LGENETEIQRPENTTLPFITFFDKQDFAVINITFDGQTIEDASGLLIQNCNHFQIENCTFINISRNAVRVTGISENFIIKGNRFNECNSASLILFGSPGQRIIRNFFIINNYLIGGIDNGKIGLAFAANGTVANNSLIGCEHGIATRCVTNILIQANQIENCMGYAFYLGTQIGDSGSDYIRITNNHVQNCGIGISRYYGSYTINNVTIENNRFLQNNQWDILADFPAIFVNNTLTSYDNLNILTPSVKFISNHDINSSPIFPGDINNDLEIDMKDVGVTARFFGLTSSSESWNPLLDIISNEIIDMQDLAYIARNFGIGYV
jgi:hypothetical protein